MYILPLEIFIGIIDQFWGPLKFIKFLLGRLFNKYKVKEMV